MRLIHRLAIAGYVVGFALAFWAGSPVATIAPGQWSTVIGMALAIGTVFAACVYSLTWLVRGRI